jgi:hypothetical protein
MWYNKRKKGSCVKMKIVNEKMNQTACFSDLSPGAVFYFPREKWYGMRLDGATSEGDNAVDLQTGELANLPGWEQIIPLKDAHLII